MQFNNVSIVLSHPQGPRNIGSTARAMKNMNFRNLILVNPTDYKDLECRKMAYCAEEILDECLVYDDLKTALKDHTFVVGTTRRTGEKRKVLYHPEEIAKKVVELSGNNKIAILFGREDKGLYNEELDLCDVLSTIPAHYAHLSLNLSQAVLVYCYEIFRASVQPTGKSMLKLATVEKMECMYEELEEVFVRSGFLNRGTPEKFMQYFRKILGRAYLEDRDVRIFRGICGQMMWAINDRDRLEKELEEKK